MAKRKSICSQPTRTPDSGQRLGDFEFEGDKANGFPEGNVITRNDGRIITTEITYFSNLAHLP